jgi:group II intron reverse transcriptase/maturase
VNAVHLNGRFSSEQELREKLDFIYEKSKNGGSFHGILEVASNEVTIITAIHNIKSNGGANTPGMDKARMDKYLRMDKDKLVALVQSVFRRYKPKPARRVYIQKSNGKLRPLGIPTVLDRIIQECLRIVLEPMVEAKFFPNSYGFRPYRSVHDAVHMVFHYANLTLKQKSWYVIEGDIKGFFDHIDHHILLDKLWGIGLHDKRVLSMIKAMLKAGYMEQDTFYSSEEGTPQGGILSPLLANVYLNSFDWTVGRMYQQPRQQTAYICSDRLRLKYQGVVPKYLVRYADDWVILTNSEQEAYRLLHKLQKYFTHKLKIELSQEKTIVTNMRESPVNFLGFSLKVRKTVYQPDKPKHEMVMSYPNPQKLQKAIRMLCDGVRAVRTCSNDEYRAVQVEKVNAQIAGLAEHYKHVLCSEAYHKIDFAVNKCAFKTFKRIYGKRVMEHVIPLEQLSNRPLRHAGHKDTALAVNVHGQWIGLTKAYLTHAQHTGRTFHQAITPYTPEGRELYYRKAKKLAPKVRPPLYDGTTILDYTPKKRIYNFEYYMNREYAFNRDKGVCRCCRANLNPGHYHCHHINPSLPITQINKVSNLAWVCEDCHGAIHGKGMPSYATGKIRSKIESFQNKLNSFLSNTLQA